MSDKYEQLLQLLRENAVLESAISVLGWDERVNMPAGSAEGRAEQLAFLARLHHETFTAPRVGDLLGELESDRSRDGDPQSDRAVNIFWTRRAFDRATKLPPVLVEELTRTASLAESAWITARQQSDFKSFEPWLDKQIKLKREQAECYGYREHIYDALLDDYEPFATTAEIAAIFAAFRPPLVELIQKVLHSPRKAPIEKLNGEFPIPAQLAFGQRVSAATGFDFDKGRIDTSVHPFCTSLGRGDTRMTTRFDPHDLSGALFGILHESGHALYDQGLDESHWGLPRGKAVSLGIHESQSRLWENLVGRSRAFWKYWMPIARQTFPESLAKVSDDDWIFAINDMRASFIRTEADEATYNLHIMLRFDLEQAMLKGDLNASDVPAAWNARMQSDLGITPPDDRRGCLQDTHWAAGLFGYFPTYALGNMAASQFFESAEKQLGDLHAMFARGEFKPLLDWLRANIHREGMKYPPRELIRNVTGEALAPDALLKHLSKKADDFYGVCT